MSGFKNYVQTGTRPEWSTNACVYATEQEARDAGAELAGRWLLVTAHEPRPTAEDANYVFFDGRSRSIKSLESKSVLRRLKIQTR